jgi:hypothetical protein
LAAVAPLDWPKGTTWLLKWVSQPHIHTHYLVVSPRRPRGIG